MTAAYGLVNANKKWQVQSDFVLLEIGFQQLPPISQLFHYKRKELLIMLLSNIVDDLLLCRPDDALEMVTKHIELHFKPATITLGPGSIRYFGIDIFHHKDYIIEIYGDNKF